MGTALNLNRVSYQALGNRYLLLDEWEVLGSVACMAVMVSTLGCVGYQTDTALVFCFSKLFFLHSLVSTHFQVWFCFGHKFYEKHSMRALGQIPR